MLKQIIDENHYDIVYCHTSVGALLARIACKDAQQKQHQTYNFFTSTMAADIMSYSLIEWALYDAEPH